MPSLEIRRHMDATGIDEVSSLIADAWRADGARPLNDHLWLDLREGGRTGFAGIIARETQHSHIVGYCQVSRGNESWSLDLIVHPHHRYDSMEIAPDLIRAALDVVASEGGGHVHWWVFEPNNVHRQLAHDAGLVQGRRLIQMRRPLPLPSDVLQEISHFTTTSFNVNKDENEWLRVNNAAFASHPEQGGWTHHVLLSRMTEPWFDAEGIRMLWNDNTLSGFCWTKIHQDTDAALGEIYVIAVDPSQSGKGLGRKLTIAGLQHMSERGVATAMLYVDADNTSALSMYESLGFQPHHNEHAFVGDISPATATS